MPKCRKCVELADRLAESEKRLKANYEAYRELAEKFEKLAAAYCFTSEIDVLR